MSNTFPTSESGFPAPARLIRPANSTYTHQTTGITYIQKDFPNGNNWVIQGAETESDPLFTASPADNVIDSGLGDLFLADDGTYKQVPPAAPLEISESTIAGYVDKVNGDDANDGLTPSTPKQTLNAIASVVTAGRIYVFAGSYSEAIYFSSDPLAGENRIWYFENGVTINLQQDLVVPGIPFNFGSTILNIEGNAIIKRTGTGTMIDTTNVGDFTGVIECKDFTHFPTSSGVQPVLLSADVIDFLTFKISNILGYTSTTLTGASDVFITEQDPATAGKFGRAVFVDDVSATLGGVGTGRIDVRDRGFINFGAGIGFGAFGELYLNIWCSVFPTATVPFVKSVAEDQILFANYEYSALGNADIEIATTSGALSDVRIKGNFINDVIIWQGNLDVNDGTVLIENIKWNSPAGAAAKKIIARGTAELTAKNSAFTGWVGAIEALAAGVELDMYDCTIVTSNSGNTVVTDTASTRLWKCAFDPAGTYAVATSGGAVAIAMDQNVGSKALDPNITDTIGNYTFNAAWAGIK